MSITEIIYCESKDYLITGGREGSSIYKFVIIFLKIKKNLPILLLFII